jgi:hypothetical protein
VGAISKSEAYEPPPPAPARPGKPNADYTADMPNEEILRRLLALNLARVR